MTSTRFACRSSRLSNTSCEVAGADTTFKLSVSALSWPSIRLSKSLPCCFKVSIINWFCTLLCALKASAIRVAISAVDITGVVAVVTTGGAITGGVTVGGTIAGVVTGGVTVGGTIAGVVTGGGNVPVGGVTSGT